METLTINKCSQLCQNDFLSKPKDRCAAQLGFDNDLLTLIGKDTAFQPLGLKQDESVKERNDHSIGCRFEKILSSQVEEGRIQEWWQQHTIP